MYSKCVVAADVKNNLRSKKPDTMRYLVNFSAFNFQYVKYKNAYKNIYIGRDKIKKRQKELINLFQILFVIHLQD